MPNPKESGRLAERLAHLCDEWPGDYSYPTDITADILALLAERDALREELTRCERRLSRTNDDRAHWRERARSAEQALGLYGAADVLERPE